MTEPATINPVGAEAATPSAAIIAHVVPPPEPGYRDFLRMTRGYWSGDARRRAWVLSISVLAILFANLAINVGLNQWNRYFFDALEKKDGQTLATAVMIFVGLIAVGAAFAVAMTRTKMHLQLDWRAWTTRTLLAKWLTDQNYYRIAISEDRVSSPDARIAEDVRLATEPVIDFATGFLNACLSAITFASILFVVGGSITIWGTTIPGYIAVAAVCYAVIVSGLTFFIGRPLSDSVDVKNETEASFRYGLTRVRENVESIALTKGDSDERRRSLESFEALADATRSVIRHHCNLTWVLNANSFFAGTFALLIAVPKYLTGDLTLGAVMQIAAAFTAVLAALNWFAENFVALSTWKASAQRVALLDQAFDELSHPNSEARTATIEIVEGADSEMVLRDVSLSMSNGKALVDSASVTITPGERVLLGGESGTGKSTLIRAIAGLWPWGNGRIELPRQARLVFLPQRPYMPRGTLRDALAYPAEGSTLPDDVAKDVLRTCGLHYKLGELDQEAELDQTLSGGERQRVAFARLLIQKPNVIIMDEATAALDPESEERLLTVLFETLPDAMVLSVGHRPALEAMHGRKIVLRREESGARLQRHMAVDTVASGRDLFRRLLRRVDRSGRFASRIGGLAPSTPPIDDTASRGATDAAAPPNLKSARESLS